MDHRRLKAVLHQDTRKHLWIIFRKTRNKINLLYRVAAHLFSENDIHVFERMALHPGFSTFLRPRLKSSLFRLEDTFHLLLRRVSLNGNPDLMASIAERMSWLAYRRIEKSFFMVPVDLETFRMFERGFVAVAERDLNLVEEYLEFCSSLTFTSYKQKYLFNREIFSGGFHQLVNLLYYKRDHAQVEKAAHYLLQPSVFRFLEISIEMERWKSYFEDIFTVLREHPAPEKFFECLNIYHKRYPMRKTVRAKNRTEVFFFLRLIRLWKFIGNLPPERIADFKEFLHRYGNPDDEFENFVWDIVFELDGDRAIKAMSIFVSTAFTSLRGFYGKNAETIRFLVKNIITVIMEIEIRDIQAALYRVVLKLLVGLKIDRGFIKRRAEFFHWLKHQTGSFLLELEVIRFMFFEYIYIALKQVDNTYNMKMTRFCDENHRQFCHYIDELYSKKFRMRAEQSDVVFKNALESLRLFLWAPMRNAFDGYRYELMEVISIAETVDREDAVFGALGRISAEHLPFYHEKLVSVFRDNPGRIDEAIEHDYWCRVPLTVALSYVNEIILPLTGAMQISESDGTIAATDGKTIYLPPYIGFFLDPLDPITDNRNLTAYIAMTLHEIGHVLGGSFCFNLNYYLSKLEYPELFRCVMNIFEDFRVESYLIQIRAYPRIEKILSMLNQYYAVVISRSDVGVISQVLFYVTDEAGGYNRYAKEDPGYHEMVGQIMNLPFPTGRFRGVRELVEYCVSRLQNIDAYNPLAVYPLARELYEILKEWPEEELAGLLESDFAHRRGHDYESMMDADKAAPFNEEELIELYREYNKNQQAFFRKYHLAGKPGEDATGRYPDRAREYLSDLLSDDHGAYHDESGIFDYSVRTRDDDDAAARQLKGGDDSDVDVRYPLESGGHPVSRTPSGVIGGKARTMPRRYVYTIDPRTKSRTRLSEIREYAVHDVSTPYFIRFKKWEYLAQRVYRQLSVLLPSVDEDEDTSSFEGEMNIELLIEFMSNRHHQLVPEFLDVIRETRRTLEVVIGIDASASTSLLIGHEPGSRTVACADDRIGSDNEFRDDRIMDVEKAFAIIFGRALSLVTDRVAVYAFNSVTSTNVYRAETIDAVSSFVSDAQNRDGDFIRYIRSRLERSDADEKYFFLVSDGRPNSDNYQGREALDDTLIAIRETVNAGIKLIYFNIDINRGDYFELFQQEATYAEYFTSPEQILPIIPELVKSVLASIG